MKYLIQTQNFGDAMEAEITVQTPCGNTNALGRILGLHEEYPVVEFYPVTVPGGKVVNPHVGVEGLRAILEVADEYAQRARSNTNKN